MPESYGGHEHPVDLLVGADHPRPLPLALRDRLEEALAEVAAAGPGPVAADGPEGPAGARAISPEVRDRLEVTLLPGARRPGRWKAVSIAIVTAAAVVAVVGAVTPGLFRPGPNRQALGVNVPARALGKARHAAPAGRVPAAAVPTGAPAASRTVASTAFSAAGRGKGSASSKLSTAPAAGAHPPAGGPVHPAPVAGPENLAVVPPAIGKLSPSAGPTRGGNWVVVTGSGFEGVREVMFGDVAATRFVVVSPSRLRVLVPAHSSGTVGVVVLAGGGRSAASPGGTYKFVPPG